MRFSDHRPVCAKFVCAINIIDESLKGELRHALCTEIQHGMHGTVETGIMRMGIADSEAPPPSKSTSALPPASSDIHRWWLSDGMWNSYSLFYSTVFLFLFLLPAFLVDNLKGAHAKSGIKPPGDDFAVNIDRSPNPFSLNGEFDWVRISNSVPKGPEKQGEEQDSSISQKEREFHDTSKPSDIGHGSPDSRASERPQESIGDVKTPPQIPRKPMFLVSKESRPDTVAKGIGSGSDTKEGSSNTVNKSHNKALRNTAADDRNTADLLNDVEDGSITWKPLLPQ